MNERNKSAEALSHYSRHFSIVCEYLGNVPISTSIAGIPQVIQAGLFRFTHQPSGEVYNVLYNDCKTALERLKDHYNGVPHQPIPVYEEE